MKYFFTADEHYGHHNIIEYCDRPFKAIDEMNDTIIANHNAVVSEKDTVIHAGDFTLRGKRYAEHMISQLEGNHIFIRGSHDYWLPKTHTQIWERKVIGMYIVVCHYAMRTWPRSHHGSIQLYGHSHGKLEPIGLQYDVGVDNNDFYPVSDEQIKKIMGRILHDRVSARQKAQVLR